MLGRNIRALLTIPLCALYPSIVGAQAAPGKTDPGVPGEEHKRLDVFVGTWDVTVSFPAGPGTQMEGTATCEARWAMDGRFLRQEYSSTFMGKPLTVVRYLGFDRHRRVYVEVQLESTRTDVLHAEGLLSADGLTMSASGRHVDAATGELVDVRTVTRIVDDDTFTVEYRYAGAEGPDTKTIVLTHRRRSDAARR